MARVRWIRAARHACEAAAAHALFALLGALPVGWASAVGAALGGLIGPLLPVHRQGLDNLARALPELSPTEMRRCARRMWCHLGRVAAEYPHLHRFSVDELDGLIELVGRAHLDEAKHSAAGGIFFSGHIGNWEVAARAPEQTGVPLTAIYRAANNPIVDRMIERYRGVVAQHRVPKGTDGAREIVRALGAGNHAALLVDQKFNTGIPVPFFGRDAMTAPAVASLALKYECPVWPVRVERLAGTSFRVTVYPKLALPQEGTREERVRAIMVAINRILEDWIRERPEQWLWLHRRWPD